jgi:Kef-type K+ transport system membrane component KefB
MSFADLALISIVALAGPLLAIPVRWHIPVVVGELGAGVLLGSTGTGTLNSHDPTFTLLANAGFALVMFVAGSQVPIRDARLRPALKVGALRAIAVGAVAALGGVAISAGFHTGHAAMYAVLLASSSAALVLPIVDSLGLGGEQVLTLLPQVAVADAACIVALPLALDPGNALRSALGALAVIAAAAVAFVVLRRVERSGLRRRVHRLSERRKFAIELRVNLAILFGLAEIAVLTHVSILLAGFSFGLATAAIGEPRRLAKQLFAVSDGFLGPIFFVWLGASLDLGDLGRRPSLIGLGVVLGLGTVLTHWTMRLTGQPLALATLAGAQLGVPIAAATVGTQLGVLEPGEPAALILGALVSIAAATVAGGVAVRAGFVIKKAGPAETSSEGPA